MIKSAAILGIIVLIAGFVLFYETFTGGYTVLVPSAQQALFLVAILALPIGMAIASYGFASRPQPVPAGVSYRPARSGLVWAALGVAVIGIILGAVGIVMANSASSTVTNQLGTLPVVNIAPTERTFRVDWTNTDPTGQDRFNPSTIIVNQGDKIFLVFEENDTDAHTFTLTGSVYSIQINDTVGPILLSTGLPSATCSAGQNVVGCFYAHNFVTNGNFTTGCSNSSAAPNIGCVTGSSLLPANTISANIAFNAQTPVSPPTVVIPKNTNTVIGTMNDVLPPAACTGSSGATPCKPGVYGIAAFTANTPGIFEYFCFYHVSNGMFGYLIVLPNKQAASAILSTYVPNYIPVADSYL
jgi:plastocyanin